MSLIFGVVYVVLSIFMFIMWVRLILDFALSFSRGWRPQGFVMVVAEIAFTITDPPIKLVRRVIPPLRTGGIALDFAWPIVMFAAIILSFVVGRLAN